MQAGDALAALLREPGHWPDGVAADGALLERAEAEGVSALLLEALARHEAHAPAGVREQLRGRVAQATARDLLREHELQRLLAVLAGAGIEPVVLKGRALAHLLYARPALRPSLDADLMIPAAARGAITQLLRAEGYASTAFQGGDLVNAQVTWTRALAPGVDLMVDVHWRISTSPLFAHVLPYGWLRARAQRIPALGPHALGPAFADALLHACLHRAPLGARAGRLIWLYDIHLLSRQLDDAGWTEFTGLAARHKLRAICLDALRASARRLGTRVPPDVLAALDGSAAEPSAALLRGGGWRLKWAELASLQGPREHLTYLRETALPAPAYLFDLYGTQRRWLLPALYLRRALGWLAR